MTSPGTASRPEGRQTAPVEWRRLAYATQVMAKHALMIATRTNPTTKQQMDLQLHPAVGVSLATASSPVPMGAMTVASSPFPAGAMTVSSPVPVPVPVGATTSASCPVSVGAAAAASVTVGKKNALMVWLVSSTRLLAFWTRVSSSFCRVSSSFFERSISLSLFRSKASMTILPISFLCVCSEARISFSCFCSAWRISFSCFRWAAEAAIFASFFFRSSRADVAA
mmetsp:Transcript_61413/g.150309  ORF Transcript_61413/g.150309 Transcript_61413/m.150309 type:complete len:225 (-) Transcript_61413:843-1517(-)